MAKKDEMKENLLSEVNNYIMHLVYLKDVNEVYNHINEPNRKLQEAPNFVLITQCALYETLVMTLAKLYDKSNDAKTIKSLIKKCRNNIHLFSDKKKVEEVLQKTEFQLNEEYTKKNIEVLQARRDWYYAHNDETYFGKKMEKDESYLPMGGLWILIAITDELLRNLFSQLTSEEMLSTKYDKDLNKLLEEGL